MGKAGGCDGQGTETAAVVHAVLLCVLIFALRRSVVSGASHHGNFISPLVVFIVGPGYGYFVADFCAFYPQPE